MFSLQFTKEENQRLYYTPEVTGLNNSESGHLVCSQFSFSSIKGTRSLMEGQHLLNVKSGHTYVHELAEFLEG